MVTRTGTLFPVPLSPSFTEKRCRRPWHRSTRFRAAARPAYEPPRVSTRKGWIELGIMIATRNRWLRMKRGMGMVIGMDG